MSHASDDHLIVEISASADKAIISLLKLSLHLVKLRADAAEAKLAAVREVAEAERATGNEQAGINILAILDGGAA